MVKDKELVVTPLRRNLALALVSLSQGALINAEQAREAVVLVCEGLFLAGAPTQAVKLIENWAVRVTRSSQWEKL